MHILLVIILLLVLYLALNPGFFTGKPAEGFAKESEVLSYWNKGICITGKNKRTTLEAAFRHSLICGQSGSGKSQASFLPELLRANGSKSYVVHDAGELEKSCGGYLRSKNYDIKVVDLASLLSNYYNPLQHIDQSFSAAKRVASVIVSTSLGDTNGDGKFFNIKAEQLLSVLIAVTKQLDPKYHHMGSVVTLLNAMSANPAGLDFFMADKCKNKKVFEEYSAIAATDPRLLSNLTSTAKAAISVFDDEIVMQITSKGDFSFSQLREKPTVIILKSAVMSIRYHAPIFSLIITQLMETLLAELPKPKDLPVVMHLDEMGILKLPNFSDFLSNSRKYKISCVLGCQTTSQIINKYGREEGNNILGNCYNHLYFSNQPLETCLVLEKMAGTVEVEIEKGRTEKKLVLPGNTVRTLNPRKAILLSGGVMPVLVNLKPAYKNPVLRRRMNLPYERNIFQIKKDEIPLPYIPRPKRVKG